LIDDAGAVEVFEEPGVARGCHAVDVEVGVRVDVDACAAEVGDGEVEAVLLPSAPWCTLKYRCASPGCTYAWTVVSLSFRARPRLGSL
jgi:hypothetical protein